MPLDWQLNTTVIALQGRAVQAAPPADRQVLTWDQAGLNWTPANTSIPPTVFNFRGAVANPAGLPTTGQAVGDTYYVTGSDQYYFWDGLQWSPLTPPLSDVGFPEAPIDGQTYGRDGATTSWNPVLPLSGGTMTGPITLAGDATGPLQPVTFQQVSVGFQNAIQFAAQFLGTIDAPVGQVFYTTQSGVAGTALVPANQKPGAFVICVNSGTIPPGGPAAGISLNVGDWLYSDGSSWIPINIAGGAGGISSVVQGNGITVNTTAGVATVSLFAPVSIVNGGTSATSASSALDALSGSAGTVSGVLSRAPGGTWSVVGAAGNIDATQVATNPVINAWTSVQQALQGLFDAQALLAPLASPVLTGTPTAPNPNAGDNSQRVATTSWVNTAIAAYVSQWAIDNGVLTDVTTSGDVQSV